MEKSEILSAINYNHEQIILHQNELTNLKEQYSVLMEFSKECMLHINSFENSMATRRGKLSNFDAFSHKVKSAKAYSQKMSDVLNGKEYLEIVTSIDMLQNSISATKQRISNDIQYVENLISSLEFKIGELQNEYERSEVKHDE